MKRFRISILFLPVLLTLAATAFTQPASPARREAAGFTASAKKLYETAQAAKSTIPAGANEISFRKALDEAQGGRCDVFADNGTKTPIRDLVLRPDRTYAFKIIASNGATLDCSGTISDDYRSITGSTRIQVGKESATGTFSGTKR